MPLLSPLPLVFTYGWVSPLPPPSCGAVPSNVAPFPFLPSPPSFSCPPVSYPNGRGQVARLACLALAARSLPPHVAAFASDSERDEGPGGPAVHAAHPPRWSPTPLGAPSRGYCGDHRWLPVAVLPASCPRGVTGRGGPASPTVAPRTGAGAAAGRFSPSPSTQTLGADEAAGGTPGRGWDALSLTPCSVRIPARPGETMGTDRRAAADSVITLRACARVWCDDMDGGLTDTGGGS